MKYGETNMATYSEFPSDFIKRTKEDIKTYSKEYDVTNLINSCLGLIVIPKELKIQKLPNYKFNDENKKYGVTKASIELCKDENYSLNNVVRHIRNGISHGLIDFESSSGSTIDFIIISDRRCEEAPINFTMKFSTEEFKTFALKVADEFLKISPDA